MNKSGIVTHCVYTALLCLLLAYEGRAEGFEDLKTFSTSKADNTEMKLSIVEGRTGNALRVDHDLRKDPYVEFGTPYKVDLNDFSKSKTIAKLKVKSESE